MNCEVRKKKGTLSIRGEMTIYGAALLKEPLFSAVRHESKACTIDLDEVSEFDTTGVQLLLMAQRDCVARGVKFTLANPSSVVRETLALLRLSALPVITRSAAP